MLFPYPPKIHHFLSTVITGSLFSCFLPMKCVLPSCKFVSSMSWPLSCYLPLGLLRKTLNYVFFSPFTSGQHTHKLCLPCLACKFEHSSKNLFLCISEKFLIYLNLFAIFLSPYFGFCVFVCTHACHSCTPSALPYSTSLPLLMCYTLHRFHHILHLHTQPWCIVLTPALFITSWYMKCACGL